MKVTRARYEALIDLTGDRKGQLATFSEFLERETEYFTAPASTRFHQSVEGGLLRHSCNVAKTLLALRGTLAPDLEIESCIICGLFHDLGKAGMPGQPYYLPNGNGWERQYRKVRYTVNQELVHLDIATRSLFLLAQHLPLSDQEAQAIRFHDGQYIPENRSVAHRECRLTRLLQYADNWAGGVLEERPERPRSEVRATTQCSGSIVAEGGGE